MKANISSLFAVGRGAGGGHFVRSVESFMQAVKEYPLDASCLSLCDVKLLIAPVF